MTEEELDEILTLRWPFVVQIAKESDDKFFKDFAFSIARKAKKSTWHPSAKEKVIIKRLVIELLEPTEPEFEVIERF